MIFLSKHTSLHAGRLKWILDIIWPLNQRFNLKNQRNWLKWIWMLRFWSVINCIFLLWAKKLTLTFIFCLNNNTKNFSFEREKNLIFEYHLEQIGWRFFAKPLAWIVSSTYLQRFFCLNSALWPQSENIWNVIFMKYWMPKHETITFCLEFKFLPSK